VGSLDSCVCRSVFIMESLVLPMVGIFHSRDVQLTHGSATLHAIHGLCIKGCVSQCNVSAQFCMVDGSL
jgi:hypothetical protein